NNNGWLEEDPEEEPEEEEIEDEDMVNNEKDDDEVINPYEEADPHNRPPPTSDEETEFAPPMAQIADADDVPIPPVIQFGSNIHVGESLATRDLLASNSDVYAPGPMCCDLRSVHRGVKRLSKHMHDRYRTEKKMEKKLRQDELRMNVQEFDITALDSAVRENRFKNSKMMRLITSLSREFIEFKNQNRMAKKRSQTNPQPTLTQEDVDQLVRDGIEAALRAERKRVKEEATRAGGPARGPAAAPMAQECSFTGFMKCGPTQFHGTEGAVGLVRWFEKMENTFKISDCAEGKKVKFATATLHGRALTWWNSQVATLGREVANGRPWTEVKQMMTDEFCLTKEVQRLEDELRHLKLKDMNIAAYTERFNELALLCPNAVPNEKKKVELYIKGLPEIIKGETTLSRPVTLNEAMRMAHALMEQKIQAKNERIAEGLKRKWENNNQGNNNNNNNHNRVCYECGERGHKSRACSKKADQRGGNVQGQAYVIRDADHNQGPNVVTVGMDWLVERDALIMCGKKEVHVPYKNKTLVVKSDSDVSQLKVISCIKARKYIERGSQLFISQVTKKEPAKKQLQDVPVICNFPEVFPDDLPGLPPPRQVEFKIELIPGAAPVARAPYRLAPSELS
nr:hypothetical protein [Tanacetum cinerariifolium]